MWPEDAVSFFGDGDECHVSFHFPLMPRIFMALKMEDRYPIEEILKQTPKIPETCQWANFLRNHDELTLEMVTDEERDYMYRAFAHDPQAKINAGIRRRLAPLLRNNRRQIELLNGLLFSLIGTPVLYYGDEIGMGDNIYLGDRNGVRTPMQWSPDRNAGFSQANPQKLVFPVNIDPEYHFEAINVEGEQNNPNSLLWWMRRMIALRKRYKALSRGTIEFLPSENHRILAFVREWEDQKILVVINLSRFAQGAHIDMSAYAGLEPVELFGQNNFPIVGEDPYFITLSPHSFLWFSLRPFEERSKLRIPKLERKTLPTLEIQGPLENILNQQNMAKLIEMLPDYLRDQHWFAGRSYKIRQVKSLGEISLFPRGFAGFLMLIQVDFVEKEFQAYLIGLIFGDKDHLKKVRKRAPQHVLTRVEVPDSHFSGGLYNAVSEPQFCKVVLEYIEKRKGLKGAGGEIIAYPTKLFRKLKKGHTEELIPEVIEGDQNNTLVNFGKTFILKIFRQLEWGANPDLELSRFLSDRNFPQAPPLAGVMEFVVGKQEPVTLALLYGYVANQGQAWDYTLDHLSQFFESAQQLEMPLDEIPLIGGSPLDNLHREPDDWIKDLIGPYLVSVARMGELTGKLHKVLASEEEDPKFRPEPMDPHYQRSFYEAVRSLTSRTIKYLHKQLDNLPDRDQELANKVIKMESKILKRVEGLIQEDIQAVRIRCHGDFHLRQLLNTGKDFVIIDYEGEPGRHWSARKLKRSSFRDVASMLRSFHYATYVSLGSERAEDLMTAENAPILKKWGKFWYDWVSVTYLKSYLQECGPCSFIPESHRSKEALLSVHLLEKCIFEISFELEHRPQYLKIPLQGILQLMGKS